MDIETFLTIYKPLIVVAFIVSFINWTGYSLLAPWYRSAWGKVIWTKFLANVLVLSVPFMQVMFNDIPFRREASIVTLTVFIVAISIVAWYIWTRQGKSFLEYKRKQRLAKKVKEHAGTH